MSKKHHHDDWDYAICRNYDPSGDVYYSVHKVEFLDGVPVNRTLCASSAEADTPEGVEANLRKMLLDIDKHPIVDEKQQGWT